MKVFKKRNYKIFIPAIIVLLGCFSCQTAIKLFLRVKEPKKIVSNEERVEFYQPFIEKKPQYYSALKVYTVSDTTTLMSFVREHHSYPIIMIKNIQTDFIYSLNCFEDVEWDVNNINKKDFEYVTKGNKEDYKDIIDLSEKTTIWHQSQCNNIKKRKHEWDVYIASGTFLGKKLRRLTLPITGLKSIRNFTIIDLSVNENEL